jgi:hypothetical protein
LISISRAVVRQVRSVFGKAFGSPRATLALPVYITQDSERLTISGRQANWVAEYTSQQAATPASLVVPLEAFSDCQGTRADLVTFTRRDASVVVEWTDRGMPHVRTYAVPDVPLEMAPTDLPAPFTEAGVELLPALAAATDTCDAASSRYALGCIQLRGARGDIVATDGRQVLRQAGFTLGFAEELLVPSSKLFASRELQGEPAAIGKSADHVVIRVGNWTYWLPIEKEQRFPRVDDIIPSVQSASTQVSFTSSDLRFLAEHVARLPADENGNLPVTLDLNGDVAIRGCNMDKSSITELVLSNSRREGDEVRLVTNRKYLERAAKLGFNRLYVYGTRQPVLCHDDRRSYVWALLEPGDAVERTANSLRILSPPNHSAPPGRPSRTAAAKNIPFNRIAVPMQTNERRMKRAVPAEGNPNHVNAPIDQALLLRSELRELLAKTNGLVRSLKQQGRQKRLVRTTIANLKQLQTAG